MQYQTEVIVFIGFVAATVSVIMNLIFYLFRRFRENGFGAGRRRNVYGHRIPSNRPTVITSTPIPTITGTRNVAVTPVNRNGSRASTNMRPAERSVQTGTGPRIVSDRNANIENYPSCPVHRCRNRAGRPQMIFWDQNKKMYRCHYGDYFEV